MCPIYIQHWASEHDYYIFKESISPVSNCRSPLLCPVPSKTRCSPTDIISLIFCKTRIRTNTPAEQYNSSLLREKGFQHGNFLNERAEFVFRLGLQFAFLKPQKQPSQNPPVQVKKTPASLLLTLLLHLSVFILNGSCEYFQKTGFYRRV